MVNIFLFFGIILAGAVLFYLRYFLLISSIPRKLERAKELIALGDEDSIKYLNMVLEIDKKNIEANWLMAQYHIINKRYIQALSFLNEIEAARRFNQTVSENLVRESLCLIYLNLGTMEKALAQIRLMSGKEEIPRYLYAKTVKMLLELNRFHDALTIIEQARMELPDDGEFEFLHGLVLQKKQETASALIHFENAMAKGYESSDCYFLAGKCAFLTGNFERSADYFINVSSPEKDTPEYCNLLGQAYYNTDKFDAAIELLSLASGKFTDDPNLAGIYFYLGCSWEKKGVFDSAVSAWEKIDKKYSYNEAAQEKIYFYTKVAVSKAQKDFFLADIDSFFAAIQVIFRKLDYIIKETARQSSEFMEFVCTSRRDTFTFSLHYIVVSRSSIAVSPADIRLAEKRQESKKCKYLTYIAGYFSADALNYATGKPIDLIDISIIKK